MRSQDLVDEIYSQFKSAAEPFIKDGENQAMVLHFIQSAYWWFLSTLNASGIDPRTQDGIGKLWELTSQWAFPDVQLPESAEISFDYNVRLLVNHALTQYGLNPLEETIYYMEAENGTTVRVPASKLDAWLAEQERIKNNPEAAELTELEKQAVESLLRRTYGSKSENE